MDLLTSFQVWGPGSPCHFLDLRPRSLRQKSAVGRVPPSTGVTLPEGFFSVGQEKDVTQQSHARINVNQTKNLVVTS